MVPPVDVDRVFKALADPTRRHLLDRLFEREGRTLTELESELEMTRFGVMKHLRVLEEVGLVVTRRSGRKKLHFLNPVPIRLIHDRWIDKYTEPWAVTLTGLKKNLEETMEKVFEIYIRDRRRIRLEARILVQGHHWKHDDPRRREPGGRAAAPARPELPSPVE